MEIEILPTTKFSDKKISDLTMPKELLLVELLEIIN